MAFTGYFKRALVQYEGRARLAFVPTDGLTEAQLLEWPEGVSKGAFTKPRRHAPNRLYWSLLNVVSRACDVPAEHLHKLVKVGTGYTITYELSGGQRVPIEGSIAFDKMDEAEFRVFLQSAIDFIITQIIPEVDPGHLMREAEAMLGERKAPPKRG